MNRSICDAESMTPEYWNNYTEAKDTNNIKAVSENEGSY